MKKTITSITTAMLTLALITQSASAMHVSHVAMHTTPRITTHVVEHTTPHIFHHTASHYHYYNRGYTRTRTNHNGLLYFILGLFVGHHFNHHQILNHSQKPNTTPSEVLSESVMTKSIKSQIGHATTYNHSGAFTVNNNKSTLNANINSAPYATDIPDRQNRAADGEALLNKSTRQYKNRQATNNGANNWKPAGFIQRNNLSGKYQHAYDRGHLLGYALIGNVKGFDASESNPRNVATQTAWANEAQDTNSTGQNYYEGLVRKALDQNKTVRYSVKDLYENNTAKVPSGAWIQAKSKDGSVNFNVFIPNVQAGLKINYQTGVTSIN